MQNLTDMTAGCLHTGSHNLTVFYSTKYDNRVAATVKTRLRHYEDCDAPQK